MKSIWTSLLVFILWIPATYAQTDPSPLEDIQSILYETLGRSLGAGEDLLSSHIQQLEGVFSRESSDITAYWLAYGYYQQAIYFTASEDDDAAEEVVDKGIELLEDRKNLDAEGHVLLGSLLSFSIRFSPLSAYGLSKKANKHYQTALKLDPKNLRAYLNLGKSDYYKPKQYGGGKMVEEHLLKALTMPDQTAQYAHAPCWGRDEAYYFLIQYYQREDRTQDAMSTAQQASKKYPYHSGIKRLMAKME